MKFSRRRFIQAAGAFSLGTTLKATAQAGPIRVGLVTVKTGPLGAITYRVPLATGEIVDPKAWNVKIDEGGRYHTTVITAFNEDQIDPSKYLAAIADEKKRRDKARQERLAASQPK